MPADPDHTRTRLVAALRRGPTTLDELVAELGLTRTALRLQLVALERDGHVARRGVRRGRTKPSHVYELTTEGEQALSSAYIPVLTQLLHVLSNRLTTAEFDDVMRAVGRGLIADRARPRGTLHARVNAASDLLDQLGGLTEVDQNSEGFTIRSHGCPLAAAAAHHPETCSAMEDFVSEFVGSPVTQHCDRIERPRCRFHISADDTGGRDSAA